VSPENVIKGQLAMFAIQEGARHGGAENMAAVAFAMCNRVNAGWYGGDWMKVLEMAPVRAGTRYPMEPVNLRDTQVRQFLQRIDDIFDGSEEDDPTNGGVFYCELNKVEGEYFKTHVLGRPEQHPRVAQVGPVTFFK
jgi:hypothetical protein